MNPLTKGKNWLFVGLILLPLLAEVINWTIGLRLYDLSWLEWISLGLGASFVARAISYMRVGEPIRAPFTKVVPHGTGFAETIEPKYEEGLFGSLCLLVSCPFCTGLWVTLVILFFRAYFPDLGRIMIYVFGAGSLAMTFSRYTEWLEWQKNLLWEQTALTRQVVLQNKTKITPDRDGHHSLDVMQFHDYERQKEKNES